MVNHSFVDGLHFSLSKQRKAKKIRASFAFGSSEMKAKCLLKFILLSVLKPSFFSNFILIKVLPCNVDCYFRRTLRIAKLSFINSSQWIRVSFFCRSLKNSPSSVGHSFILSRVLGYSSPSLRKCLYLLTASGNGSKYMMNRICEKVDPLTNPLTKVFVLKKFNWRTLFEHHASQCLFNNLNDLPTMPIWWKRTINHRFGTQLKVLKSHRYCIFPKTTI